MCFAWNSWIFIVASLDSRRRNQPDAILELPRITGKARKWRRRNAGPRSCHELTDLATDEQYLLVDIGLSESATPGLLFLSRLLLFEDFAATGGAALVLGELPRKEMAAFSADWKRVSSSRDADYDPGPLICTLLQKQMASQMRYRDEPSSSVPEPQMLRTSRRQRMAMLKDVRKAGAIRRCPCGSGKMFKNCCLEKQR
jgi:hypothetical protein